MVTVELWNLSVQVDTSLLLPQPRGPLRVHENMRTKVVVMKMVPSSDLAALARLAHLGAPEAKAVVLELAVPGVLRLNDPHLTMTLRKARVNICCARPHVSYAPAGPSAPCLVALGLAAPGLPPDAQRASGEATRYGGGLDRAPSASSAPHHCCQGKRARSRPRPAGRGMRSGTGPGRSGSDCAQGAGWSGRG